MYTVELVIAVTAERYEAAAGLNYVPVVTPVRIDRHTERKRLLLQRGHKSVLRRVFDTLREFNVYQARIGGAGAIVSYRLIG